MSVVTWDLQKAIYQHLRADSALQSELGTPARIFDDPPPEAAFPYLTLGEARASDWNGVDGGLEHELKLYVFSRYAGRREVKRILGVVYDVLHEAMLSLPDHDLVNIRFVFGDVFRRQDGETYQGVARFRAVTQEKELS